MTKMIHKKIVYDEQNMPVEVIISYDEWKKIEHLLTQGRHGMEKERLQQYSGTMHIEEEPLEYQRRMRSEWK